jgi:hypothetical protein
MGALAPTCLRTGRFDECDYKLPLSPLWHPFVAAQALTLANMLNIAYCALVFVYLALPAVRATFAQVAAALPREELVRLIPRLGPRFQVEDPLAR